MRPSSWSSSPAARGATSCGDAAWSSACARPFRGATPQEILAALLRTDYHLLGDSPDTRALDAVIQRCLAKDPRDRYASAAELTADLVPALARCRSLDARAGSTSLDNPTI